MQNIINALLEKLVRVKQLGKPNKLNFSSWSKSFKAPVYCKYCQSISKTVKKYGKQYKTAYSHHSSLSFRMWSLSQPDLLLVTIVNSLGVCENSVSSSIQAHGALITINSPAQRLFSSMSAIPKDRGAQRTIHMEDES